MAYGREMIDLTRECVVIIIPDGTEITLPAGTSVRIMQSLGGTFTVKTECGQMVRINAADADAIGQELESPNIANSIEQNKSVEEQVWGQLETCYDPEIPANIVDLGLVYFCEVKLLEDASYAVLIRFTLTAPGCGMGPVLKSDISEKIKTILAVSELDIETTFDPPWDQSRMSEAAKLQLNLM
jgi:probable FeS assembly SUF system protein SufT